MEDQAQGANSSATKDIALRAARVVDVLQPPVVGAFAWRDKSGYATDKEDERNSGEGRSPRCAQRYVSRDTQGAAYVRRLVCNGKREFLMYHGERFNSITHLIGAAFATAGSIFLLVVTVRQGDPWKIFSFGIYGAMLITLYVTSTLYHSLKGRPKNVLRKLDYCAIYLMIAGSYTPFALVSLRNSVGWLLFSTVWTAAAIGVWQEIWLQKSGRILSLAIYVTMGWLALIAINPLIVAIGWSGFIWVVAGGLFYTVGIVFFIYDQKLRHAHGIWHLFVLAGSICHYITILYYVA